MDRGMYCYRCQHALDDHPPSCCAVASCDCPGFDAGPCQSLGCASPAKANQQHCEECLRRKTQAAYFVTLDPAPQWAVEMKKQLDAMAAKLGIS